MTIEWEPAMWSSKLLGTRVKVTNESSEIVGVLGSIAAGDHKISTDNGGVVSLAWPGQWGIYAEKVPPVVLPDVEGTIIRWNANDTHGERTAVRRPHNNPGWHHHGPSNRNGNVRSGHEYTSAEILREIGSAKFTVLRPEAEVAAEVLAAVSTALNLRMVPEQGSGRVVLSVGNFTDDLKKMRTKWAKK
jgi:hypothetical protein